MMSDDSGGAAPETPEGQELAADPDDSGAADGDAQRPEDDPAVNDPEDTEFPNPEWAP
jgi:hypothetical protein